MSLVFTEEPLAWLAKASTNRERICGGCCSMVERGSRCGRCRLMWYCSKPCQADDWTLGGHRKECAFFAKLSEPNQRVLLQNPRLRLLARLFIRLHTSNHHGLESTPAHTPDQGIQETEKETEDKAETEKEEKEEQNGEVETAGENPLTGLRDAVEEARDRMGEDEEGSQLCSTAEANWQIFLQLYLNNSAYFRNTIRKRDFMQHFGIICANTFPIIHYSEDRSKDVGFGVYAKAARYEHSCAQPDLRYTTDGRTLRVLAVSPRAEAGETTGLTMCRIPYTQGSLRMPRSQRQTQLWSFAAIRCVCPACAAPPLLNPEHALIQACEECSAPLHYNPDEPSGKKTAVCSGCGTLGGYLDEDSEREIRNCLTKLRRTLLMLPASTMEIPLLELREECRRVLHPVANVLVGQLNSYCFQQLCILLSCQGEMEEGVDEAKEALVNLAALLGKEAWESGEWAGEGVSANDALLASLISRLYGNMGDSSSGGWAMMWLNRAVECWEDIDSGHPLTASLTAKRDALLPSPQDGLMADLEAEMDAELDVDVDDPEDFLGMAPNDSASSSPRAQG